MPPPAPGGPSSSPASTARPIAAIARYPHEFIKWGQFGRLEALLAEHGTKELVLVGTIMTRPDVKHMKLDFGAVRLVARVAVLLMRGDNDLLSGLVGMFSERGYKVVGAHEVAPELVAPRVRSERTRPTRRANRDARRAMKAARVIGKLDAGQAAVVVNGLIVALEAYEGTDGMLERVGKLREAGRVRWKGRAGVLAKCAKPQQDLRVDMPTIGVRTVARRRGRRPRRHCRRDRPGDDRRPRGGRANSPTRRACSSSAARQPRGGRRHEPAAGPALHRIPHRRRGVGRLRSAPG